MSNMDYTKYAKINNATVELPTESQTEVVVDTAPEIMVADVAVKTEATVKDERIEDLPAPEVEPERKIGRVVNCTKLNVRKNPDIQADVVCELYYSTEVEIDETESTDEFYKIYTASGVEGFCMKSYILVK